MVHVYVTAIATCFGAPRDVSDLPESADPAVERVLRDEGFRTYFETAVEPWQAAAASAAGSLDAWRGPEPDLVAYGSESVAHAEDIRYAPARFAVAAGLPRTEVLGVTAGSCANLVNLLRVARGALAAGDAKAVLVVTTDARRGATRILDTGGAVFSDGAASCVVTTDRPEHGYRLAGLAAATDSALYDLAPDDTVGRLRGTADGVRRVLADLHERTGVGPADARYVVLDNFGATAARLTCTAGGIDVARVRCDAGATGHVFAADLLVNLVALDGVVEPGELVLGLASSRARRTAVLLERL